MSDVGRNLVSISVSGAWWLETNLGRMRSFERCSVHACADLGQLAAAGGFDVT